MSYQEVYVVEHSDISDNKRGFVFNIILGISKKSIQNMFFVSLVIMAVIVPLKVPLYIINPIYAECIAYSIQYVIYIIILFVMLCILLQNIYSNNSSKSKDKCTGVLVTYKNYFMCNKWLMCLILFLLWVIVCELFSDNPAQAWFGNARRSEGFIGRFMYIVVICAMMQIDKEKTVRRFINIFSISAASVALLGIIGECSGMLNKGALLSNLATQTDIRHYYSAVFDYFNHYGYYMSVAVALAIGMLMYADTLKSRILYSLIIAADVWSLLINDTFGGFLALSIAIIIIFIIVSVNNGRIKGWFFVPILIFWGTAVLVSAFSEDISLKTEFIMLFTGSEDILLNNEDAYMAGTGRWNLWTHAFSYIMHSPFVGYGDDGLGMLYHAEGFIQDLPANEYIQYTGFYGLPGGILYLIGLILLLAKKMKQLKELNKIKVIAGGAVISYAISAAFGNSMYYTAIYFFILIGITANEKII